MLKREKRWGGGNIKTKMSEQGKAESKYKDDDRGSISFSGTQ